ncbi:hypothetical protein F5144DRAFT_658948 [Chaetomium tenue]|uniref:Uncharacterized protein n=1 Tax=Chaetomium tenue TaxID=1854479 RepID=A0ACB7NZI0_9PEZI|nr:hypothetical protein F5144DRAFT_658948 [Chaetomium globosum]
MEVYIVPSVCRWPYQPSWELDGFDFNLRLADTSGSEIRALYRPHRSADVSSFGHPWEPNYSHIVATNVASVFQAMLDCKDAYATPDFWLQAHAVCEVPGIDLEQFLQNAELFSRAREAYLHTVGGCPNNSASLADEWATFVASAFAALAFPPPPVAPVPPSAFFYSWDENAHHSLAQQPTTAANLMPWAPAGWGYQPVWWYSNLNHPFVEQQGAHPAAFRLFPLRPNGPGLNHLAAKRRQDEMQTPTPECRNPKRRKANPNPGPPQSPAAPILPSIEDGHENTPLAAPAANPGTSPALPPRAEHHHQPPTQRAAGPPATDPSPLRDNPDTEVTRTTDPDSRMAWIDQQGQHSDTEPTSTRHLPPVQARLAELIVRIDRLERGRERERAAHERVVAELLQRVRELEDRPCKHVHDDDVCAYTTPESWEDREGAEEDEHTGYPATSESEAEPEAESGPESGPKPELELEPEGASSSASDDGQDQGHHKLTQQQQNPHPHHIYDASYNPHPHHIYFESSSGGDDEEQATTDDNEWEVDSDVSGQDRYCKG